VAGKIVRKKKEEELEPVRELIIKDGQARERKIGMVKQMTINMGNFNSAKVGVWMEMTVPDDERMIKAGYTELSESLEAQLNAEIDGLKAD
jgi:hypothetical protein